LNNAQMANQQAPAELAALRQEIASLRDTTTQFDMSVERTLTELQHRVASLEAVRSSTVTTSNQAETQGVEVGRRRSQ
jgi:hypothetical protein